MMVELGKYIIRPILNLGTLKVTNRIYCRTFKWQIIHTEYAGVFGTHANKFAVKCNVLVDTRDCQKFSLIIPVTI